VPVGTNSLSLIEKVRRQHGLSEGMFAISNCQYAAQTLKMWLSRLSTTPVVTELTKAMTAN